MTAQIKKSLIGDPGKFAADVATFVSDLNAWSAHAAQVKKTERLPKGHAEKFSPYPAPIASALVMSAVSGGDGKYKSDFVIVDDGPTPGQILEAKKNALIHLLSIEEDRAKRAILSNGKRRLRGFALDDINTKIASQRGSLTDAERALLDEHKTINSRDRAVERLAAEVHAKIDDLTVDNVDKFTLPSFPA